MSYTIFSFPTRVIFGPGSIDAVGVESASLGQRALLVTGTTFARRSGMIDRLMGSFESAHVDVSVFDKAGPNPRVDIIDEGALAARERNVDIIVGLGGGSTLDAAKAIALAAGSDRSIWDFTRAADSGVPDSIGTCMPIVQLPIVASTGSETNDTAVVFHEQRRLKASISHRCLYARVAIVDPTLTFSVPPGFTAVGGMNIVSQLLESYLTRDEFAAADRVTEGFMRVVMDSLPRAMQRGEDLEARTNLSWVAAMAPPMTLTSQRGLMPLRAMAHPLCAHTGIDHGSALAALWSSYMRFALSNRFRLPHTGRFKRYALMGRQIFGIHETDDEAAAEMTIYRFESWLTGMGIPTSLHALGVGPEQLNGLAEDAILMSGDGARLPGGFTITDIEHIYDGAMRPRGRE
jgi:butanol dehydrogenase